VKGKITLDPSTKKYKSEISHKLNQTRQTRPSIVEWNQTNLQININNDWRENLKLYIGQNIAVKLKR
jgi:hypothetical protein